LEDERIIKLVNRSINRVIGQDSVLFTNDVSELSISHKLAEYIQPRFSEYNVDCEYNRNVESEDLRKKNIFDWRNKRY